MIYWILAAMLIVLSAVTVIGAAAMILFEWLFDKP